MFQSKILVALVITTIGTQQVQAASEKCVSDAGLRMAISYFMPKIVESGVVGCTKFLAKEDYLSLQGQRLIEQYKSESTATRDEIETVFAKLGGPKGPLPKSTGVGALTGILDDKLRSDLNASNCNTINRFMTDLGELPATNMIGFTMTFVKVMTTDDRKKKARRSGKPIEPSPFCEN